MLLLYSKFILILITALNISNKFKLNFFKINLVLLSIYTIIILYFSFFKLFNFINILFILFLLLNLIYFIFNFNKYSNLYYVPLIIIILLISHYFIPEGFLYWDEFAQWGIKPKEIFINKSIFIDNITTNNKYWTIALYHNLLVYGINSFDEKTIILSQIFLHINCLLFVNSFIKKKSVNNLILLILLFYFSSSIFNYGYYSIYLDILVFLYFICIFLTIYDNKFISWNDTWIISILFVFLFLIKGISIFFGFLVLGYLLIAIIEKKIQLKKLFFIIFIFLIVVLSYQLLIFKSDFGYHIKPDINYYNPKVEYHNLNDQFSNALYSINIYEGKFLNLFFKINEVLNLNIEFFDFLNFKLNYYFWTIFLVFLSFLFVITQKENSYFLNKNCFYVICISLILFSIFIYYSYRNYFGPAEAASMSSFGRYFGIFFIFWLFIIFINLINIGNQSKILIYIKWLLLVFVIISSPGKAYENLSNKFFNLKDSYQTNLFNKKKEITILSKYVKKDKKIYFISQNKDEFFLRVARFISYPIKSNELCSSIVDNKDNQKTYDCVITKNNFFNLIENYDYLFFLNNNTDIIEMYNLSEQLKKIKSLDTVSLYEVIKKTKDKD